MRRLVLGAVLLAVEARAQDGGWVQVADGGPPPRAHFAMVFDDLRGRVVLFGGETCDNLCPFQDTWSWDGTSWTELASAAPGPLGGYSAAAFDSSRGVMVLVDGQYTLGTWEWDGGTWTQVSDAGPPAQSEFAAMAYDSLRHRSILFGGSSVLGTSGDTWSWDGKAWAKLSSTGPPPRSTPLMAYDRYRDRVIVFGGTSASFQPLSDTWEFDGLNWSLAADAGPLFYNPTMAWDGRSGTTVLFGAANGVWQPETWRWDGVSWAQIADAGATGRGNAVIVYDSTRQQLVVFGGENGVGFLGDTWTFVTPGLPVDAGVVVVDGGAPDAGAADAGSAMDAGVTSDGGSDGGAVADAGTVTDAGSSPDGGPLVPGPRLGVAWGCASSPAPPALGLWLLLALLSRRTTKSSRRHHVI
jgi:hypothetical protein